MQEETSHLLLSSASVLRVISCGELVGDMDIRRQAVNISHDQSSKHTQRKGFSLEMQDFVDRKQQYIQRRLIV